MAFAGQLGLGDPVVSGDTVTVPIILQAEQSGEVSTLDFRVRYDPSQLRPVAAQPGPAAQNADKDVMSNERGAGEYSVVLMGLNRNIISDGEVASITFQRVGGGNAADVRITQTTFASPDALEIPSRGSSRTLNWDGTSSAPDSGQQADSGSNTGNQQQPASPQSDQPGQTQTAQAGAVDGAPGVGGAGSVTGPGAAPGQTPAGGAPGFGATEQASEGVEEGETGAAGQSADAQRQLRGAIASADTARQGVDTLAEGGTQGGGSTGTAAPSPQGAQAASTDGSDVSQQGQTVDARIQVSQAREVTGPASRAGESTGGQQPRGLPETTGNPTLLPLLITAAIALVAIGGLFMVRKKLFS